MILGKIFEISNEIFEILTEMSGILTKKMETVWRQITSSSENIFSFRTDDIDFNLSGDGRDVVLQLQSVGSSVRADTRFNDQLCESGLRGHADPLVSGGELLLAKGPLGNGGRISADGDSDGERMRDDHLQPIFESAQV